jgi:hypothetical protein
MVMLRARREHVESQFLNLSRAMNAGLASLVHQCSNVATA